MKIEAGKYYRTRDGRRAYVAMVSSSNPFNPADSYEPAYGYIEGDGSCVWELSGRALRTVYQSSVRDLVSEYREPEKVVRYIHIHRHRLTGKLTFPVFDNVSEDEASFGDDCLDVRRVEFTIGADDEWMDE